MVLAIFGTSLPFAACVPGSQVEEDINFENLAAGYNSEVTEKSNFVIKDEKNLQKVWGKTEEGNPPEVDFLERDGYSCFPGATANRGI